jgi:hypothetical protein
MWWRLARPQETSISQHEEGAATTTLSPTCFTLYILAIRSDGISIANCWIGSKVCLVTTNTGATVTTARPAREEAASSVHSTDGVWEDPLCLERGSVELTLGWSSLQIWVFAAKVVDRSILGLMSCKLTKRQWIWSTIRYNWAKKRYCHGMPEHDHSPYTFQQ